MNVPFFISRRLRYKGRMVTAAVAVSFLVVIIAVAVSAGFRREIYDGISEMTGDLQLTMPDMNVLDESSPLSSTQSYIPEISELDYVEGLSPVICRAGIVKHDENIFGVFVRGIQGGPSVDVPADSVSLAVAIPASLADVSGLKAGDRMLTYFIGEKVKVRQFNIVDVYEPLVRTDDRFLVYADIEDLRRLNGWNDGQVSMFEIDLNSDFSDTELMDHASFEIAGLMHETMSEDDDVLVVTSVAEKYPQIFDWLNVIEFNVIFVLILMIIVAGVNMMTGLLIMLFEHTSMIGLLKSLGMTNTMVAKVFLTSAAGTVLKGMLIGNLLAFGLCLLQNKTHLVSLDPTNYFVSFVPMHIDPAAVLLADAVAFVSIMLLLLIPSLFVMKVDPARTLKVE